MKSPLKAWRERRIAREFHKRQLAQQIEEAMLIVNARNAAPSAPKGVRSDIAMLANDTGPIAPFQPPVFPKGVKPAGKDDTLAMDYAGASDIYAYANMYGEAGGFMGFPALIALAQVAEYRKIVETIAEEMTRQWISIQSKGGDDKTKQVDQLNEAIESFKLRELFHQIAEQDGYYGRAHLFIDVNKPDGTMATLDPLEMKLPLIADKRKLPKGALIGFRTVEPMWCYPGMYNSNNPLSPTFYNPSTWLVQGNEISATRLMTFVSRPVANVIKPAYAFGGLSLTQLAMRYVRNWIRTQESCGDLVNGFSIPVLKMNLSGLLAGGTGATEQNRVSFFQRARTNFGVWLLNMGTESDGTAEEFDFKNVPLSGLDKLQAQAQEQMASITSIPLVKLLGITPSGLNASSEGELDVFDDHIHARQERFFRPGLQRAIELIQLHLWGEIDPDITFKFNPLQEMNPKEASEIRVNESTTAANYINAGVLMPEEVREALAADEDNPYHSIDLTVTPEPPEAPAESDGTSAPSDAQK
jgi:phage-related protein (TIGR01555 family)